jgi:hypothetical protein
MNKIQKYLTVDFLLLFISLFSSFYLWDLKIQLFDFRILIIVFSLFFFIKNFKFLEFRIDYLIISILFFILIHYYSNQIIRDLDFNKNIFFFLVYLLISYQYLKFNKEQLNNIFPILSKSFLLIYFFFTLIHLNNYNLLEQSVSGSCALFNDLSSFKLKILNENSHFGMVAPGAFFCVLLSIKKNEFLKLNNILFYFIIFFLCVVIFSMTLLLGLVVSFTALLFSINKKNYVNYIIPFIFVFLSVSSIFIKESCSSRIERLNFLDNVNYININKKHSIAVDDFIERFIETELIKNCKEYKVILDLIYQNKKKILILNKEIEINEEKMKKFKNATEELFAIQLETKNLMEKKLDLYNDLPKKLLEYKKNCDFIELTRFEELIKKQNLLNSKIKLEDSKYTNPNITTQVYQVALLNTYSSIKENIFGWGYDNYAYSHFKYVLRNMTRLNIESENKEDLVYNIYDTAKNIQDPDVMYLNYNDGRNNFSKLVTEFGFFTVILFTFLFIFGVSKNINLIDKSFIIPIIATQLGSGAGYVNGGFIIAILIAIIIYRDQVNKKIK